jgi:purine-binding chemotaxis protein CheW
VPPESDVLVFDVCGEPCALPVEAVQEIAPMASVARLPGLPSLLEGFLNLRGTAVPVLRLGRLFGAGRPVPGLYTPLVVMRGEAHLLALLVDAVIGIARLPADGLLPVDASHSFNGCAAAEVVIGGRAVHLLSGGRLLLEQERQCLAELQARAQKYLEEAEASRA